MSDILLKKWRSLQLLSLNLIESLHHFTNPHEIELLKKTDLFNTMNDVQIGAMLKASRLIRYPKDKLVFREGEQGDALYIIVEGSVRVFTYDMNNTKIALARLNQGDYFGEQALLGEANKTRNANIETITATSLLSIPERFISVLLHQDKLLKTKLRRIGFEQALNTLSLMSGFYTELTQIISQLKNPIIKEYPTRKSVFSFGDRSDNVYMILQGKVELLIPDKLTGITSLTLNRGQLFGELGVLQNQPRSATAIAEPESRLLIFTGEQFKQYFQRQPETRLNKLLTNFQKTYELPKKGIV